MIKFFKHIILQVVIIITFFSFNLSAADYPNTSIGIIEINRIIGESKAGKDVSKQFEKIRKKVEGTFEATEKKMLEERNKLIEEKKIIAPEAFEVKAKAYEEKLQNYQVDKQKKVQKLESVVRESQSSILKVVEPILEDISSDFGITVIMEKNSVWLSAESMNLTDLIIKELDSQLPKLKISFD